MRSVAISELKAHLAEYLRVVRSGEEVVVMDRGRPVARLLPFREKNRPELVARKPIDDPRGLASLSVPPVKGRRVDSVAALLVDRQSR